MPSKRFKKIVRTIHKYEGRVLKVAAPVVGAAFGGIVGAAAGTALGTAASYYGEKQGALASGKHGKAVKKAGKRGLKSGLIIGGIVTGGAAIAAVAGVAGAGLATGPLTSVFAKKPGVPGMVTSLEAPSQGGAPQANAGGGGDVSGIVTSIPGYGNNPASAPSAPGGSSIVGSVGDIVGSLVNRATDFYDKRQDASNASNLQNQKYQQQASLLDQLGNLFGGNKDSADGKGGSSKMGIILIIAAVVFVVLFGKKG